MGGKARVVVVGGGIAGMEVLFTLRQRLGDRVDLTLVADRPEFVFRPNTVYVPFGGAEDDLRLPIAPPTARRGIEVRYGRADWVETRPQLLVLTNGDTIAYDYLVIATGAAPSTEEVPGLAAHALLVWSLEQMREIGREFKRVRAAAVEGWRQHVLFLVPEGNLCPSPVYELAFMFETWLRRNRVRDLVTVTFATAESTFLQAFGTGLHHVVSGEFAERGVIARTGARAVRVEERRACFGDGTAHAFDLLVSAAPQRGAVDYEGLAADDRGFLLTEPETRRVIGTDNVYAPGDAGDFPIKLGFLSLLQADAVADDIAARIDPGAVERARRFDPVGMCVLEMFDDALFTQVPLTLTGNAPRPTRPGRDAAGAALVGISPIWRLGRKAIGIYLPQAFRAGRPFHAGLPWGAVALGLRGMSKALAGPMRE